VLLGAAGSTWKVAVHDTATLWAVRHRRVGASMIHVLTLYGGVSRCRHGAAVVLSECVTRRAF
jgi:hypothetical protein